MKFSDLPIRIHHDISGGRPEQVSRLIDDMAPFIQFCREEGRREMEALLSRMAAALKEGLEDSPFHPGFEEDTERLTGEISRLNLESIEPGFLAQRVTVFACLKNQKAQRSLAMALENPFIQRTLEHLLKKKERLVRDYSLEYRIKHLLGLENLVLICGAAFARRAAENGLSRNRIVCIDFQNPAEQGFRKTLIFPFLLQDLNGIF